MMTDEDCLIRAVVQEPHDDDPRLAYADLLDETGDPAKAARAEFIRVQIKLAGRTDGQETFYRDRKCLNPKVVIPRNGYGEVFNESKWVNFCDVCELCVLHKRQQELLSKRKREWFSPWSGMQRMTRFLSMFPVYQFPHYEYRRGFVEQIEAYGDALVANAAALFSAHPIVRVGLANIHPKHVDGDGWRIDGPDELGVPGWFPTEEAAVEALSERAVAFGRLAAGLSASPLLAAV